jgi:Kef-type K+ transport system membrane component KefB
MTWSDLQAEPAFGFAVVGLVIVFGPLIAERLRLPGLLGLLVFGAVVGPAGRSVVAVTHNPGSESTLTGSTLTFPVGGSLGPA